MVARITKVVLDYDDDGNIISSKIIVVEDKNKIENLLGKPLIKSLDELANLLDSKEDD